MSILTNSQCASADAAGASFKRHKRASRESVEAFLETGHYLVEARPTCKRGQWGEWLARADIDPRTARYMLAVARSGASADDIEAAGGVRAFRESLAEKTEPGSVNDAPDAPPETPDSAAPPTAVAPTAQATTHQSAPDPEKPQPTSADALRREAKRARGECIDCPNPSPDHVRCTECRTKIAERNQALRANARTGAALRTRLQEAAERGSGIRITAEEVARLLAV